jgi:vacuolar iron transporter family protein
LPDKRFHRAHRVPWLRAAVMGANDGIISTSGLLLGVAAAHASHASLVVTGISGLVAGAIAMAAGEYVAVSSQADLERAELALEQSSLSTDDAAERKELAAIYIERGLDPALAVAVAQQLMAHDALTAHARDELGISETLRARPLQAALASGVSFACGAALPLTSIETMPAAALLPLLAVNSVLSLATLGGIGARLGGASIWRGAVRVASWGALALAISVAVGTAIGH